MLSACMLKAITDHGMFHNDSANKGLWNFLRNIQASPEQAHDRNVRLNLLTEKRN